MKRIWIVVLILVLLLCACGGGRTNQANLIYGPSQVYEQEEVRSAMVTVMDHFEANFKGCSLNALVYDEARSLKMADEWASQYKAEQAIVLLSSFTVDENGGDGSLEPGEIYDGWQWVLTRSGPDSWILQTWGYA